MASLALARTSTDSFERYDLRIRCSTHSQHIQYLLVVCRTGRPRRSVEATLAAGFAPCCWVAICTTVTRSKISMMVFQARFMARLACLKSRKSVKSMPKLLAGEKTYLFRISKSMIIIWIHLIIHDCFFDVMHLKLYDKLPQSWMHQTLRRLDVTCLASAAACQSWERAIQLLLAGRWGQSDLLAGMVLVILSHF